MTHVPDRKNGESRRRTRNRSTCSEVKLKLTLFRGQVARWLSNDFKGYVRRLIHDRAASVHSSMKPPGISAPFAFDIANAPKQSSQIFRSAQHKRRCQYLSARCAARSHRRV